MLLVVSGPSGVGKTTVVDAMLALRGAEDIERCVTATTRPPRDGEQEGIDYFFMSEEAFRKDVCDGAFLEYQEVHGNLYGTRRESVIACEVHDVRPLVILDMQGAEQVKASGVAMVSVFIMPPSFEELLRRLLNRGTEDDGALNLRLENAKLEMAHANEYDFIVVNDDVDSCARRLLEIFDAAI